MNNCAYCKEGRCTKSRTTGLRTFRPDGCHVGRCTLSDNRQETCGGYTDKPNMTDELTKTLAIVLAHHNCPQDKPCNICNKAKQLVVKAAGA